MKTKTRATPLDRQIGTRLRTLRLAVGMSQVTLADAAGITFQQIQKYEAGTNRISATTLATIAAALGVGILDLYPKQYSVTPSKAFALVDKHTRTLATLEKIKRLVNVSI